MSFFSFDHPLAEIMRSTLQHSMGIVPLAPGYYDVNKMLSTLPPSEARKMRRKFRKVWRKFVRNPPKGTSPRYVSQLGYGEPSPTRKHKQLRKEAVRHLVATAARQLLKKEVGDE